ncbi:hypothetical protein ABB37_04302 [Leptomonas pyrrhocoris]|uniref:Uncharacterized protein n=1 Tax=Leptomonas pyrrhocoris TaxID=157538 RepID=A0A0M9G2I8_LEPPY|nr:hypothetical protein ABB37_04302 [Leptomonas pyrrhocoris]KPA80897.1 hypothetical protein ABB37_04302 [Leptomonas pyrrhocoris]|eukprot:XP_015659336.1 hypothetical protein ABB37_04302 [Leptomonas pyrrhocoris]
MEAGQFAVHVLKCPFGVRGVQFTSDVNESPSATSLSFNDHYAYVSREAETNTAAPRSYAVGGTRGIQQLVATTRGVQKAPESMIAGKLNSTNAAKTQPTSFRGALPDVFSIHDKGRLLLWNSQTGALAASYAFNPAFTVNQCVVTPTCVYTTLEGSPATAGAEDETCVYAWDRLTLQPVTVLRGHEARLTALAVAPANIENVVTTDVLLATASLDGTVRLWRHHYDPEESATPDAQAKPASVNPVKTLAVLPATELGVVLGLSFIATDVLVAACSKCVLAFVRLSSVVGKEGWSSGLTNGRAPSRDSELRWQLVRSSVDPDGSTTTLHVCAPSAIESHKTSNRKTSNAPAAPTAAMPSPPLQDVRRRKNILTGSTSGYLQEWVIELGEGDGQPRPLLSPTADEEDTPPSPTAAASAARATVRGRWHNKAHAATIDCIVTDDDIVVSTSIFDGARLYHRRTGATCVITTVAVVLVLAPQLKQFIWGSVDGSVTVANYALFASGTERELQLLWTVKPHAAAIRGVCLSLTAELQWKALCIGAADGSVSVWRPASPAAPSGGVAKQHRGVAPVLSCVMDTYVADGAAAVVMTVVGLRREESGYALAVAEMPTDNAAISSVNVLPLPAAQKAADITCARLCCSAETQRKLCLFVGTRSGLLLHSVKEGPPRNQWRALGLCKWTATNATHPASITAISPLRVVPPHGAVIAVTSQGNVGTSLEMQRVLISVLRTHPGKGAVVVDEIPRWEAFVDVPTPSQGSLVSSELSINDEQPQVTVAWMKPADTTTAAEAPASNGLVVRDKRGLLVRCRFGSSATSVEKKKDAEHTWAAPEVFLKPSGAFERNFLGVAPTLDPTNTEVVVTESGESDLLCVDFATGCKHVLMKAPVRHTDLGSVICDAGTNVVRFAAARISGSAASALTQVALYDGHGKERYRVNRDGAVTVCASTAVANTRNEVTLTPMPVKASARSSPSRSNPPPACTLLAASAVDRLLFIGYDDGLLQMVDTTDMFVFMRVWVKNEVGTPHAIREVRYANGVSLVRLADDCLRVFAVPPRSILDQPMPLTVQHRRFKGLPSRTNKSRLFY